MDFVNDLAVSYLTMSSTLDRLRRLQSLRPQRTRPEPVYVPLEDEVSPEPARPRRQGNAGRIGARGGNRNCRGTLLCGDDCLSTGHLRGAYPLGDLLQLEPAALAPFHPEFALADQHDFQQAIFFDTETTGLGVGASVYAFMVGVGVFEAWAADRQQKASPPGCRFAVRRRPPISSPASFLCAIRAKRPRS